MTEQKKAEQVRREFLGRVGKVAVATPAAMATLMAAGQEAHAYSGRGGGHHGGGHHGGGHHGKGHGGGGRHR